MSTWQEGAREALGRVLDEHQDGTDRSAEDGCFCGGQEGDSFLTHQEQAIIAALAPVVEAEVRRGQAEALRGVQAAIRERRSSPPSHILGKSEQAAWTIGLARAHAIVRYAIEAGDPQ